LNFELDEEHYAFRDAVQRYLKDHAGAPLLRRHWDEDCAELLLWRGLSELGLLSLTVPEPFGGQGMGATDAVLLVEELGRHGVPYPVVETLAVAAPVLARHADQSTRERWLPKIADGALVVTVQDGWEGHAPWAHEAGLVLVAADDGIALCVPSAGGEFFAGSIDPSRRPGRVGPQDAVGLIPGAVAAEALRDYARTALALQLLGLGAAVIEQAVDYAKVREQFGRPIGSFQAIKHLLANAHVAIETARRPCWEAAWRLDQEAVDGPALMEAVAVAKGSAGEAAVEASYAALQAHGAIGYTWDCDLHLWLKRIHGLEGQFGGAQAQWRRLAKAYFGDAA
jgi:alkylation response protein AidB-like acyl-CoA dehydrogenase